MESDSVGGRTSDEARRRARDVAVCQHVDAIAILLSVRVMAIVAVDSSGDPLVVTPGPEDRGVLEALANIAWDELVS